MIKIEKGIPLPRGCSSRSTGLMTSMRSMKVGDSFLYPLTKRSSISATAIMMNSADATRKKFITRKVSEEELRVWRTV